MKVVAFDPGLSGAVAILDAETVYLIAALPVHKIGVAGKKKPRAELDVHALHCLLVEHKPFMHAFVERVGARPGQGVVSMNWFGYACGAIAGLLVAMGIPLTLVHPKAWQRHHGIGPAPDAARQRAVQLYPELTPQFARKVDANKADALLIASYGLHRR